MGMSIEDANEAQQKFLDVIRADPDKGEVWIKLLDVATTGFELIAETTRTVPEFAPMIIQMVAAGVSQVTEEHFPSADKSRTNPRGIELRTDAVQFFVLGGMLDADARWDEKTKQIVKDAA
jgi:hypothetical protein